MSDSVLLAKTAERLRRIPGFMAYELDTYRQVTTADPATDFGLPEHALVTLALCRRPRAEHFAVDLAAIAAKAGTETDRVANFVRAVHAVTALGSRRASVAGGVRDRGLLAAARDHADEHTVIEGPDGSGVTLPGWLQAAVDRFWGVTDKITTIPRELHLPILANLPLAIVEIEDLTVQNMDQWLAQRHLPELETVQDRPLRGCLLAYVGVGLLFVDRADDDQQRRVTLAHEAAHFVIDYLLPREDAARRRPELLDVLDGERELTAVESFDALLADVPTGFHTHLLERDPHGGHLSVVTSAVEERAERLALELLAPLDLVLTELQEGGPMDAQQILRDNFGLPAGIATRYANQIARYHPRPPHTLLEAIGLASDDNDEGTPGEGNRPEVER